MKVTTFILILLGCCTVSGATVSEASLKLQLRQSESTIDSIESYLNLSEYYWKEKRNLNEATSMALLARRKALYIAHPKSLAHSDYLLGTFMGIFKIYDKSNEFLHRALQYYAPLSDSSLLYKIYNNLGSNYIGLDSVDKSLPYFYLSLNEKSKFQDSCIKISTYFNIALAYNILNNDSTAFYLNKIADLTLVCNDTNNFVIAQCNLSDFNLKRKLKNEATDNLVLALENSVGASPNVVFDLYFRLAKIHARHQSMDGFKLYYDTLLNMHQQSKGVATKIKMLELSLLNDSLNGNYRSGFNNKIEINRLTDSIAHASKKAKVQNYKLILETENLAQTINQLNQTKRLQENVGRFMKGLNVLVALLIVLLLVLLAGYAFSIKEKVRRRNVMSNINRELNQYNQSISQKNDELILLGHRLKQLNNELKTENEHKDRIVSIIGSDIRKPLDVILEASDSLNRHFNDEKTTDILKLINQTGTLLEHQLNDIIGWFIIQGQRFGKQENQNVKKLLNKIEQLIKIHHKGFRLKLDSTIHSSLDIAGDKRALIFIFRYIMDRALESGCSKTITVGADEAVKGIKIMIYSRFEGDEAAAKKLSGILGKKQRSNDSHYLIYRDFLRHYRCKVEPQFSDDNNGLIISIQFVEA